MLNRTRIKRLFVKDMLDILRDRRTLIAMIVVPIVLYPLLMLGSIQAAVSQNEQIKEETMQIAVQHGVAEWLDAVLTLDAERLEDLRADDAEFDGYEPILNYKLHALARDKIEDLVTGGGVHCGLIIDLADLPLPNVLWDQRVRRIDIVEDSAEVRSAIAAARLDDVLDRHATFIIDTLQQNQRYPRAFVQPMVVELLDVASAEKRGGSLLGQIIPIILILMTITGAIYPAIDLTAGERERGTLETLMVAPVPVIEIITGKFLVVATVSLIGAALNLGSMGLTLHFGGLKEALATGGETIIPTGVLPLILLCLVPLSILFAAILLAVCSIARSFKEAQNYVTPVILVALVPAGLAALPGTELEGFKLIVPVMNMVLLTREMLLGNADAGVVAIVVLSTALYAAAAVAMAVKVFGQEAVQFADATSWRAQFDRKLIRPRSYPSSTLPLLYVAILFPTWFYLQSSLQGLFESETTYYAVLQILTVALFLAVPVLIVLYYKINLKNAFGLRWPESRFTCAAILIGSSTWILAREFAVFQTNMGLFGMGQEMQRQLNEASAALLEMPLGLQLLLFALIPAICEEALFRGLLLSGLRQTWRRWPTILCVALIFAVFHYLIQRFAITLILGALLTYVCWQARSIVPVIVIHILHNGLPFVSLRPNVQDRIFSPLGFDFAEKAQLEHWPIHLIIAAVALTAAGLWLCRRPAGQIVPSLEDSNPAAPGLGPAEVDLDATASPGRAS